MPSPGRAFRAVDIIRSKRNGASVSPDAIRWLIAAYTDGTVTEAQLAAFAMAVYFKGMEPNEVAALVDAMRDSGDVMDFSNLSQRKVDKHSTGGVGDKVSICLAPLVAACGVAVPMISGRGLGHTGGTLDKLSAIPGFRIDLDAETFRQQVAAHNLALIGQTDRLAPADRKFYALRDVTGTVESIPLIAGSIMSKKLAEGIDGLVLDVKVGSGAFMKTTEDARALAEALISTGERCGCQVRALITDMNQVLGRTVGNALETKEAIDVLFGRGPADLTDLTVELGAEMLVLGHVASDVADGRKRMRDAVESGAGVETMRQVVAAQGGDPTVLESPERMPQAAHTRILKAKDSGVVHAFNVEGVGRAAMILGAGRATQSDEIDLAVGFEMDVRLGSRVAAGDAIATVHYNDEARAERAIAALEAAIEWGESEVSAPDLIHARLPEASA